MFNDDFIWAEIYRPKTVEDCILPDKIKKTFQEYVNKKEIPNLLLTGSAGSGKCLDPEEEIELLVSDEIYELFINK